MKKSLIALIAILVVVLVATGISAGVMLRDDGKLSLKQGGEAYTESVSLEGLVPGSGRTVEYTVSNSGSATFNISFEVDSASTLDDFLSVTVIINDETVAENVPLADCVRDGVSCAVDGNFSFSVTYGLGLSVDNSAMGAQADLVVRYSLE